MRQTCVCTAGAVRGYLRAPQREMRHGDVACLLPLLVVAAGGEAALSDRLK